MKESGKPVRGFQKKGHAIKRWDSARWPERKSAGKGWQCKEKRATEWSVKDMS